MLRNKIGKPSSSTTTTTATSNAQDKNKSTKPTPVPVPIKTLGSGVKPTIGGIGAINKKVETQTLKTIAKIEKPAVQTEVKKQSQSIKAETDKKISNPAFQKTEQERLAELVSKRTAEIKRQANMINNLKKGDIHGNKGALKQFESQYGHALRLKTGKQNSCNIDKEKGDHQNQTNELTLREIILTKYSNTLLNKSQINKESEVKDNKQSLNRSLWPKNIEEYLQKNFHKEQYV